MADKVILSSTKRRAIGERGTSLTRSYADGRVEHIDQPFVAIREATYEEYVANVELEAREMGLTLKDLKLEPRKGRFFYEVSTD